MICPDRAYGLNYIVYACGSVIVKFPLKIRYCSWSFDRENMFLQMSSFSTDCPVLDVRVWQTLVSDRHEQTKLDSQENDGHAKHILSVERP